jgi:hypothetical protein
VTISEIKHRSIKESEAKNIRASLKEKFANSKIARNFKLDQVEVLGTKEVLARL